MTDPHTSIEDKDKNHKSNHDELPNLLELKSDENGILENNAEPKVNKGDNQEVKDTDNVNDNHDHQEDDEESEDEEEDEEEDDDPPMLKYTRLNKLPPNFFTKTLYLLVHSMNQYLYLQPTQVLFIYANLILIQ